MNRPSNRGLKRASWRLVLLATLLWPDVEAAEPKRVQIIHSFGRDFSPFTAVASAFRTELARLTPEPVVFREVALDAERPPAEERPFIDYLIQSYDGDQPDSVVTIGAPAMRFWLRARSRLFPKAPLLATALDDRTVQAAKMESHDRFVSVRLDIPAAAQGIVDLLPDTRQLAVVVGALKHEQFWLKEVEREVAALGLHVLPLNALTLDQLRQRVAQLPNDAVVFFFMYVAGPDGVPQELEVALAAVRDASRVPVFGMWGSQLGNGIVGGVLLDQYGLGTAAAAHGARMLQGTSTAGDNTTMEMRKPVFDWRELQRWHIPESRLPLDAELRFRPPTLWEQHQTLIEWGIAIVLIQAVLIGALVFQRARRRHAEKQAISMSGRLLTAHEDERRRLARELHDDLTQRLARLAVDAGRMEQSSGADAVTMRKDLAHLSEDVHAMSYRLHPSVLDDLGLVEALRAECDRLAQSGAVQVAVQADGVPKDLPSETSLCLYRVAQEAMNNAVRHGHASAMTVLLTTHKHGLRLAVADNGSGFDVAQARERASLGLASMRERVRLMHGELAIESTPGGGTTVIAWVPT